MEKKSQDQVNDVINVYFIENHIQTSPANIGFSKNMPEIGEFEKVEQKLYEYNQNYI